MNLTLRNAYIKLLERYGYGIMIKIEDGILQFGEHQGEHIQDIDKDYLQWILEEFDYLASGNDTLMDEIEEELNDRDRDREMAGF